MAVQLQETTFDGFAALALESPQTTLQILPELGKRKNGSNAKARRLLGWEPRSNEEAITATAESLIALGLTKKAA